MTSDAFSRTPGTQPLTLAEVADCPCGSGRRHGECCGPYLSGHALPPTAEACMRSRYTAYVLRNADHLFRTWHPLTRPDTIDVDNITWTGLEILTTSRGRAGDTMGQVEFKAHWQLADGTQADLHEVSNFDKRGQRWLYLRGEHHFHTD